MSVTIDAVLAARGCDCCASHEAIDALLKDSCPVDEDGFTDHSHEGACTRNFRYLVELLAATRYQQGHAAGVKAAQDALQKIASE